MTDRICHLILVRHGAANGSAGRCIGQTDLPLAADGRSAIERLLARWPRSGTGWRAAPYRVVSSDLQRAAESAALIAAHWGIGVEHDPRLREMSFGRWDGVLWSEIEHTDAARLAAWMEEWETHAPPDGESAGALLRRAAEWLAGYTATPRAFGEQPGVVVSHAGFIRALIVTALRRSPGALFDVAVDHAHACVLQLHDGGASLLVENAAGFTDD